MIQKPDGKSKFSAKVLLLTLLVLSALPQSTLAASEGEFLAMKSLGQEIGNWINHITPAPASIAVFSIEMTAPLENRLEPILLADLTHEITNGRNTKVFQCQECMAPQIQVDGDRLVVSRGAPDQKQLVEMGKKVGADSFLMIVVYRSSFAIMSQATLVSASTGEMISAESFRIPNLEFADAAMQFSLGAGPAFALAGNNGKNGSFPVNINLSVMEEIGSGKGGLSLGGFYGFSKVNPFYLMPSIAFRNRFNGSRIYGLTHLDVGYGYSSAEKGVMAAVGYYLFISSFSFVHTNFMMLIPASNGSGVETSIMAAGVVEIGFSIGK